MPKAVAAARRTLSRDHFLLLVRRLLDRGGTVEDSVRRVVRTRPLDPEFEAAALHRGLYEVALDGLGSAERTRLSRLVVISRQQDETEARGVTVRRSPLRDWPVFTPSGARTLERCSVQEGRWAVAQMDATIRGIQQRRDVIVRLVEKAEASGVTILGQLSDEDFDDCIKEVV